MTETVLASEAVTAAHPDKICDQISDAMVDACLASDPAAGCTAECAIASGVVFLALRHRGSLGFDPVTLAREVMAGVGLPQEPGAHRAVMLDTAADPPRDPSAALLADRMTTAFGYACDHTDVLMPLPVLAAHRIAERLAEQARLEALDWLSGDAQVQVAGVFRERRPVAIAGAAMTLFVGERAPAQAEIEAIVRGRILAPVIAGLDLPLADRHRVVIRVLQGRGGPAQHSGLTGRKTSDDSYGAAARQSGSALSGKDPSRIDRIAAYAARQAAVSLVAAGLARECEIQLSYVAGEAGHASLEVLSFGTGAEPDSALCARLERAIDFRVGAIAERLALWDLPARHGGTFYRRLAAYGHFGRSDLELPWEAPVPLG